MSTARAAKPHPCEVVHFFDLEWEGLAAVLRKVADWVEQFDFDSGIEDVVVAHNNDSCRYEAHVYYMAASPNL